MNLASSKSKSYLSSVGIHTHMSTHIHINKYRHNSHGTQGVEKDVKETPGAKGNYVPKFYRLVIGETRLTLRLRTQRVLHFNKRDRGQRTAQQRTSL